MGAPYIYDISRLRVNDGSRPLGTYWINGWLVSSVGLEIMARREISAPVGNRSLLEVS
jgi:hypothetical protein